jgi:hypothetical protein
MPQSSPSTSRKPRFPKTDAAVAVPDKNLLKVPAKQQLGEAAEGGGGGGGTLLGETKKQGSEQLKSSDFAYVPDPKSPSTWKLRIDSAGHVGGAIAAIGKGYRGQKVDIPEKDLPAVKRKILAAWKKFHKGAKPEDVPEVLTKFFDPTSAEGVKGGSENFSEGNLGRCRGVEIFAAGNYRGKDYTTQDLDEMVDNFNRFGKGPQALVRAPLVIGHEEDQELLDRSDIPAAGWPERVYRQGKVLKADYAEVPRTIGNLINGRAYRKVSAEIYDEPPEGVPGKGKMLRRVALLGGELPQVKSLKDLPLVDYAEENPKRIERVTLKSSEIARSDLAGARQASLAASSGFSVK